MNKVSLLISVIAVFISGCIAFQYEIETDNASFTLGVLTALVTVLIAWNIFYQIGDWYEPVPLNLLPDTKRITL